MHIVIIQIQSYIFNLLTQLVSFYASVINYLRFMQTNKIKLCFIFICLCVIAHGGPVRGIWFTVSGTKSPFSKAGIDQVVNKCKSIGLNTIYFSVWDQSMVNFQPRNELKSKYPFLKMNPSFSFDPLQYLVQVGHKAGLKVFACTEQDIN